MKESGWNCRILSFKDTSGRTPHFLARFIFETDNCLESMVVYILEEVDTGSDILQIRFFDESTIFKTRTQILSFKLKYCLNSSPRQCTLRLHIFGIFIKILPEHINLDKITNFPLEETSFSKTHFKHTFMFRNTKEKTCKGQLSSFQNQIKRGIPWCHSEPRSRHDCLK